jgi:hypothetical protein
MADPKGPNQSSEMEPAEGSRNTVNVNVDDRDAEDRYRDADTSGAGGITNRPLEEERRNQEELPGRGGAKPGGHAS